jgi:hypothetical protein
MPRRDGYSVCLVLGFSLDWIVGSSIALSLALGAVPLSASAAPDCPCDCREPTGPPPSAVAPGATCTLRLGGVALSTARGLKLQVGATSYDVDGLVVEVALPKNTATARIDDDRFTGSQTLTRSACAAGTVMLSVRPRPARVVFTSVPDDVAVICRRGCSRDALDQPLTLTSFPPIHMTALEATIDVEFKHPDYRPRMLSARVFPGPNLVEVQLQPRCP